MDINPSYYVRLTKLNYYCPSRSVLNLSFSIILPDVNEHNMDRIDIEIKDNKEFGDVAFLVDKHAFLNAIEDLRKKWNIKSLSPSNKFKDWQQKLFDKGYRKYEEFEIDIRDLRIRFNRPETFDEVISYALVCGEIPDEIYNSTYYEVESGVLPERLQSKTTRVAIYITPQSQQEDVLRAFSEVKKRIFKARNDGYDAFFSLYDKDEITNIKRDREWYWRNLEGESYKKIAIAENKGGKYFNEAKKAETHTKDFSDAKNKEYLGHLKYIESYEEKIRKAVKRFKETLSST